MLRRLSPQHPLQPGPAGEWRPSSASFSASSSNGGISFEREATLRKAGFPLWHGCPDEQWAVAAIRVEALVKLGLTVRPTPPAPHHAEAFGLLTNGPAWEKRTRRAIAGAARIAVWPGWVVAWPPSDRQPDA